MFDEHKRIVRRSFEELFTQGDLNVADEVFASTYVGHDPALPADIRGPAEFKRFVQMYRTAFPDLQIAIDDQIAEGDLVVTRFTARGTHRGELMGIPPTGNKVVVTGISIDRMADGKSVESWTNYDLMGMMRQLGLVPAPGPTTGRTKSTDVRAR
jgi:steroid delta-isomerase-like uncharacterized protein